MKEIKYVPVLRYRREERKALISLTISNKIMPLIEIVSELAAQQRKGDFQETYLNDFSQFNYPFMIDIPIYLNINKGTTDNARAFLSKFKTDSSLKIDYYAKLHQNKNIIPILSYDSRTSYVKGSFKRDALKLRKFFNKIAFRIFNTKDFKTMVDDIKDMITPSDILLYDIDTKLHTMPKIRKNCTIINVLKTSINFTSVIIRSAINKDVVFKNLIDGAIVPKANNSLLDDYKSLGFNAFGDFAGIRKDRTISKGGGITPSAGYLFYTWHINSYIGHKGRIPEWQEFTNHIKPSVLSSAYWNTYSRTHHSSCLGCKSIPSNLSNLPADWKRYAIQHYLYTMEEYL